MGRTDMLSSEGGIDLLPGLSFLCRFFWGPDLPLCREMVQGGFAEAFTRLAPALSASARAALNAFAAWLDARPNAEDLCRDLAITYARLFLTGSAAAGAALYQSCYLFEDAPLMGPPARRMQERLAAAGLSVSGHGNEPPDHLAVELEYLYFLLSKASADGGGESAAPAVSFAEAELCAWLPLFAGRLSRIPNAGPYDHAAVLALEMARLIAGSGGSMEG